MPMQRSRSALIFIIDLLILYTCFLGVYIHYNGFVSIPIKAGALMVLVGIAWFIIMLNSSVVTVNMRSVIVRTLRDLGIAYSVLTVTLIGAVAIFGNFAPNNKLILWPLLYGLIGSGSLRFLYLLIAKHLVKEGYQQKSVLVLGGGRVAEKAMDQIRGAHGQGYRLYGVLADTYHESLPKGFYLGKFDRLNEIISSGAVDEVIIALPLNSEDQIIEMVERCEYEGVRVHIVPDFFRIIRNRAVLENVGDLPLVGIRTEPLTLLKNRVLKRSFDVIFALLVLVVLSPLFLVLAVIIKISSPGQVFFKQERVGANNVKFQIYKFRTMVIQEKNESDTMWTTASDSRVTTIGRFMRGTNLDELPQFWNVLIGDMSVVGPRPEREYFVEQFKKEVRHYKVRHLVKSGITGWAQVNGWRGDSSIAKRVEHDIYYIENWTFWLDMKIIWLTLFGKETQKHAY